MVFSMIYIYFQNGTGQGFIPPPEGRVLFGNPFLFSFDDNNGHTSVSEGCDQLILYVNKFLHREFLRKGTFLI
jgi:hypothetical protein